MSMSSPMSSPSSPFASGGVLDEANILIATGYTANQAIAQAQQNANQANGYTPNDPLAPGGTLDTGIFPGTQRGTQYMLPGNNISQTPTGLNSGLLSNFFGGAAPQNLMTVPANGVAATPAMSQKSLLLIALGIGAVYLVSKQGHSRHGR